MKSPKCIIALALILSACGGEIQTDDLSTDAGTSAESQGDCAPPANIAPYTGCDPGLAPCYTATLTTWRNGSCWVITQSSPSWHCVGEVDGIKMEQGNQCPLLPGQSCYCGANTGTWTQTGQCLVGENPCE